MTPNVTRTELKALDTSVAVAYLNEAGREKTFHWRTGNYSTHVAADAAEGAYIKANAVAASSGAWVARHEGLTISDFGEIGGANASPAVQAMINALGYFTLPQGLFDCQDPIVIPVSSKSLGSLFSGKGREQSALVANGMSGATLLSAAASAGYQRLTMRDFGLVGDADTALDMTVQQGFQLYQSEFSNLNMVSIAGAAFKSGNAFSLTWDRCDFSSASGNAFEINGGNTNLLRNCYAHACGDDKAGFRIGGGATLISCNGVDKLGDQHFWGHFGDASSFYRIALIGCNIEDFGLSGLKLDGLGGRISIQSTTFTAPASGAFETYIKSVAAGNAHILTIDALTGTVSKGAAMTGPSKIMLTGARNIFVENGSISGSLAGDWPNWYNTTFDLLYPLPNLAVTSVGAAFQQTDFYASRVRAGVFIDE